MFDLYFFLFGITLAAAAILAAVVFLNKFEYAVFIMCLSPWISAILYDNVPDFEYKTDAGIGSYIRIAVVVLIGAVGLFKFVQHLPKTKSRISVYFIFLIVFIFWAIISTIYSIDKEYTLIRSVSFLALLGFLLGLDSWLDEKKNFTLTMDVIYKFMVICAISSLIALIFLPGRAWWWENENRFLGLWDQPNTVGAICMLSYPVLLWKYYSEGTANKKLQIIAVFVITVIIHYLSGSRTSLLVAGIGIFTWFIVQKKFTAAGIILIVFSLSTVALFQLKPQGFQREGNVEMTDLTGRDEFWKGAKILIAESPILGYGYSVDGKVWQDARFYNPKNSLWIGNSRASLHNGYISVAIGVGLIALALWCLILFAPFLKLIRLKQTKLSALIFSSMLMILISNVVESTISGGNSIESVLFWITWVLAEKLPGVQHQ